MRQSKHRIMIVGVLLCLVFVFVTINRCKFTYDGLYSVCVEDDGELENRPIEVQYSDQIVEMLNGKVMFPENLSCGFSDRASIMYEDNRGKHILQIASDGCPYLYVVDTDKFIKLSIEEITTLHAILEKYGLVFPCA